MLKLKMMLCVMMLPLVVVGCTSQSSLSCEATTASGAGYRSLPPTGRHRWTGLFHPQREADHYANNWKEPRSILMSSVDRAAYTDGQLMQLLWAIHNALPAEYINVSKVIKPSNPFTNVCWVSVLTTFSAPPQILAASTVFFCPIPETKKWWVMVSFGATAAGLFWTVTSVEHIL